MSSKAKAAAGLRQSKSSRRRELSTIPGRRNRRRFERQDKSSRRPSTDDTKHTTGFQLTILGLKHRILLFIWFFPYENIRVSFFPTSHSAGSGLAGGFPSGVSPATDTSVADSKEDADLDDLDTQPDTSQESAESEQPDSEQPEQVKGNQTPAPNKKNFQDNGYYSRSTKQAPSPASSDEKPARPRWTQWLFWMLLLVVLGFFFFPNLFSTDNRSTVDFDEFLTQAENDNVLSVEINNNNGDISGEFRDGQEFKTTGPLELSQADRDVINNIDQVRFTTPTSSFWANLLQILLPISLLILFFWWMTRRTQGQMKGIMSIGRSKAKTYSTERPGTTFEDIAGYEGVKKDITEIVDFLREPTKFAKLGAKVPKGVLLVGPPGTGKTLIARAVAGEAGVPFLSVTGSDFMEMFVGVGASRVRDLFQSAAKMGRAIIFVDEIDSIGRKRGAGLGGGHDEREQTLNQMLSEMDGFETTEGIVVIAATNRPDILDPALLRPGRFDRQVVVPLPELADREAILKVHTKKKELSDDVDLEVLARGTPGMSGADLANLVNEAALYAVRKESDDINMSHFEYARDRVIIGQKRETMVLSDQEKKTIAYHEAGHAVCAATMPTADPLHKVTIIPSGFALGVTMQLPDEERHIYRQDYIEDSLVVRMGGRVAEELVFDVISTGANNDLVGSTELARKMVREWGMSQEVGPMAWGSQGEVFLGEEIASTRVYSDETARIIDEEVEKILRKQENRCRETLKANRQALDMVAQALLEHETIPGKEVVRIVSLCRNGAVVGSDD